MASPALFDLLQDFGKSQRRGGEILFANEPRQTAAPAPNVSEIVRDEVARAEAALTERLALDHEGALAALRQSHAVEVEGLRREFGEQAGRIIADRIGEMEVRVSELATSATARILAGVLNQDMQKRSLDSLAQSIRNAIGDAEAVRIHVRGPQSLFETLRLSFADRAEDFDYLETPGFDLTVTIDGNLFETRLSEWSNAILEILA
ncbi:MAG: hypothetical protein H0T56_07250 [Pseudaminobacter sp.]|nr:hypothetical protein [Pseudaminobacter sp.]